MIRSLRLLIALGVLMNLAGCGLIRTGWASMRSTEGFKPLDADAHIFYEPGAEALAKKVSEYLAGAIETVEREQYRAFAKPVQVYVCATEDSFAYYTGLSKEIRGALVTKVFLSGKLAREPFSDTVGPILTHELSHLHLQQRLGVYRYNSHLPSWFQEGLAVMVSGGGGAETVSSDDATRSILDGASFVPDEEVSFLFHKSAKSYGLKPHMFYRQSSLYVDYLKRRDPEKFAEFLCSLEDGRDFESSFNASFGEDGDAIWKQFISSIRRG